MTLVDVKDQDLEPLRMAQRTGGRRRITGVPIGTLNTDAIWTRDVGGTHSNDKWSRKEKFNTTGLHKANQRQAEDFDNMAGAQPVFSRSTFIY